MSVIFHISKNGLPQKCNAKEGNCPLGTPHFSNENEAVKYADELNEQVALTVKDYGYSEDLARTKVLQDRLYQKKKSLNEEFTDNEARLRGFYVEQMTYKALSENLASDKLFRDEYGVWLPEREKLHEEIMSELREKYKNIPSDNKAIMSGGISGAGKTTVLTSYIDNVDISEYATISSDDIKEMLAERNAIPHIDGLTQMESSTLVHNESSYLANKLLYELSNEKKNIIYDFTCKDYDSAKQRINILKEYGYKDIDMVFVDIPVDTSIERGKGRYQKGLNNFNGIGGRYLPISVSEKQRAKNKKHNSVNVETLIKLKYDESLGLKTPLVFDNSGNAPVPITFEELEKGRNK